MTILNQCRQQPAHVQRLADWTFIAFYGAMTSLFAWRLLHLSPETADEEVGFLQWDFWMGLVWLVATLAFVAVTWSRSARAQRDPPTASDPA